MNNQQTKELQMAFYINKSNLELIEWNENFINYIYKNHRKIYNESYEYADKLELMLKKIKL